MGAKDSGVGGSTSQKSLRIDWVDFLTPPAALWRIIPALKHPVIPIAVGPRMHIWHVIHPPLLLGHSLLGLSLIFSIPIDQQRHPTMTMNVCTVFEFSNTV